MAHSHPKIILGTANFGTSIPTAETVQSILAFLKKNGVNHLDTAAVYPGIDKGRTETLLGETKAAEQGFVIDTKILRALDGDGSGELEPEKIHNSFESSMKSLGVDSVDTLYLHRPDPATPVIEQARAMNELYSVGKFKNFGLSNFTPDQLFDFVRVCIENGLVKPKVYQGCYNLIEREDEKDLLPLLRKHGMQYYAYRPLMLGFLKSTYAEHQMTAGSKLSKQQNLNKYLRDLHGEDRFREARRSLVEAIQPLDISGVEAAVRWICYHSALDHDDGIIFGASAISQIEETLQAVNKGPLPEATALQLDQMYRTLEGG